MPFHPNIHHRRSIRHREHDYSLPGAYFITACAHNRESLFGHIATGQMHLNHAGRMLQSVWDDLANFYPNIRTDEFIIMPDHIHGIIHVGAAPCGRPDLKNGRPGVKNGRPDLKNGHPDLKNGHPGVKNGRPDIKNDRPGIAFEHSWQPRGVAPTDMLSLPDAVHRFKSLTTKYYMDAAKRGEWPCFNGRLWQRNYWERIIRSDTELQATREYIRNNTMRWQCL